MTTCAKLYTGKNIKNEGITYGYNSIDRDDHCVSVNFGAFETTEVAGNIDKYVYDENGNKIDYEAAVILMDDDIRERLHATGIENKQMFFDLYTLEHEKKYNERFTV